jgi:tetratricopeptide (TPR) repeat protein
MKKKPAIFVASSLEGLPIARAIQQNLDEDAEVTVWNQSFLKPNRTVLDAIIDEAHQCDFAVFVISADDKLTLRGKAYKMGRDNVIMEFGLFIGIKGKGKCFLVRPRGIDNLRLPTDLLGLIDLTYDPHRISDHPMAALGSACSSIRLTIQKRPTASSQEYIDNPETPSSGQNSYPIFNLPAGTRFIGRTTELTRLKELMLPYPQSREWRVAIEGVGGVGKSALAIELGYQYLKNYNSLPPNERFQAIIWSSAKRLILTPGGVIKRKEHPNTLSDLFRDIATAFHDSTILQSDPYEHGLMIKRILRSKRTLLIVDDLETIDDAKLTDFIGDLPEPTKLITTSRHRFGIAVPIELKGMPQDEAIELIHAECDKKHVLMSDSQVLELEKRSGGIPLAIVWSIGLMSSGRPVNSVLRLLTQGTSKLVYFCFSSSVGLIRGKDSYRLLLMLALFDSNVGRKLLGDIAGFENEEQCRDEAIGELLRLSLVYRKEIDDSLGLLPLTHSYIREELGQSPDLERDLRDRWTKALIEMAKPYGGVNWRWRDRNALRRQGPHFAAVFHWADSQERHDIMLQIAPALLYYYDLMGDWATLVKEALPLLSYASEIGNLETVTAVSDWLNWIYSQQGRHEEAKKYCILALESARRLENPEWICSVLVNAVQASRRRGDLKQAVKVIDELKASLLNLEYDTKRYLMSVCEFELGKIARENGDWEKARDLILEAQRILQKGPFQGLFTIELSGGILLNLGLVAYKLNDLESAASYYAQAEDWFEREGGSAADMLTLYARFAQLEEKRGKRENAKKYAQRVVDWCLALSMRKELLIAREVLEKIGLGGCNVPDRSSEKEC